MAFIILHLSDMHCADGLGQLSSRVAPIVGALQGVHEPGEQVLLFVTGDIARTGKKTEYEAAASFLTDLAAGIEASFGSLPEMFCVPGNHDCDLAMSDSIRQLILERYQAGANLDELMVTKCLEPLQSYSTFAQELGGLLECHTCERLMLECHSTVGDASILLLNSGAWYHKGSRPGELRFPVADLDGVGDSGASIRVALIHHPYGWFEPSNARELRSRLESTCDVIFTGHEHRPDSYLKSRGDLERALFIEGGVLQDIGDQEASTFNIVRVTDTREYQVETFAWADGAYLPLGEPVRHTLLGSRAATRRAFVERTTFSAVLEDAGADFLHPRKKQILLTDIFVYPEYQRLTEKNAGLPTIVSGRELLGLAQEAKGVLVFGEDKAGKTTAARMLFRDFREAGKVPLLVTAEDFRPLKTMQRMKALLGSVFKDEYSRPDEAGFWQLSPGERVLIVDDFDEFAMSDAAQAQLLAWVIQMFGAVVLFAAKDFRLRELLGSEVGAPLRGFRQLQLLEFGFLARHRLVSKWCALGRDISYTEANLHGECLRREQLLSTVLGRNLVPSWPLFLLIMLQQLENRSAPDSSVASFGRLYGAVITSSLAAVSRDGPDLESNLNYLSVLAWELFETAIEAIARDTYEAWHARYCETFAVAFGVEEALLAMDAASMLVRRNGSVRFRYRYCYQFFVAKYLAEHIQEATIRASVRSLGASLHLDDAANILVFLCHLCKDAIVLDVVLETATGLFAAQSEFDVAVSPPFLAAGSVRLAPLAVATTSPRQNLEHQLEERDRRRVRGADSSGELSIALADDQMSESVRWLRDVGVARRVVQIAGQILRNYYGTMRADQQERIMRAVYGLGLRTLTSTVDFLGAHHQELVEELADRVRERARQRAKREDGTEKRVSEPDRAQMEDRVEKLVAFLVEMITLGSLKEISNAIGLDRLRLTLDRVVSAPENLSYELIDTSIRLDYFDEFPEAKVLALSRKAKSSHQVFALGQLRYLVWQHFHLYYREYRTIQAVCSDLEIAVPPGSFLLSSGKRFGRSD